MSAHTLKLGAGVVALAAFVVLTAAPAQAQPGAESPYGPESGVAGVTVYGPHRYVRQPTTGAVVRLDQVSQVVRLGDLDLSTPYGAHVAKRRIERAARDVCDRAEEVYPKDVSPDRGCYSEAVTQALARAERVAGYPIVPWGYR